MSQKSVKNQVDEIVIVDTGSVDATKQIAFEYTDKVYDFEWINDFAAAKNAVNPESDFEVDTRS